MKIFISYAREDYKQAKKLYDSLKSFRDINPWLDQENLLPGAAWEEGILSALDESRFVILVLSDHSINKDGFVQKEINEAISRFSYISPDKIYLIPARVSDCKPKHRVLKSLQWVDLFKDWEYGVQRIVDAFRTQKTTFQEYLNYLTTRNKKALPFIESHERASYIKKDLYELHTHEEFPTIMSIDGEFVHNPIYTEWDNKEIMDLREQYRLGGEKGVRVMLIDLYLIKAYDQNNQPMLLQYFSGTQSAGWRTWLFPHALGFQTNQPDLGERMETNGADFATTVGITPEYVHMSHMPHNEYMVSFKPDFGYGRELVLYCFMFTSVTITKPNKHVLQRTFDLKRGEYQRKFRWFYFEELQNDKEVLSRNADILKSIHTVYATSLVPIPVSIEEKIVV